MRSVSTVEREVRYGGWSSLSKSLWHVIAGSPRVQVGDILAGEKYPAAQMRYIILAYEPPQDFEARSGRGRNCAAWRAYIDSMYRAGIIESMDALLADYVATTVRTRDGRRQLHDGPYADTTEQLGGYVVINVANLDRALEWAEKCPAAASGAVEVRPLMQDCLSECLVRPDGSVRRIQGRSSPIRDAGGTVNG